MFWYQFLWSFLPIVWLSTSRDHECPFKVQAEPLRGERVWVLVSQWAGLWPRSLNDPSRETKLVTGRRESERKTRDTISFHLWIPFVMFVKPAGKAYPAIVWRRGWARWTGSGCRAMGKAWPTRRHGLVCDQDKRVMKEKLGPGMAVFTQSFCCLYKSQSHSASFLADPEQHKGLGRRMLLLCGCLNGLSSDI